MSLPSWERGLKFFNSEVQQQAYFVAPLVGAWIEIFALGQDVESEMSLPSWERGLKSLTLSIYSSVVLVAPLVGAWIEM